MRYRPLLCLVGLLLLSPQVAVSSSPEASAVGVRADDSRFESLAERVAEEIELLLAPEPEPWTVRRGGDSWQGASVAVSVGPVGVEPVDGRPGPKVPRIFVDPVGRPAEDGGAATRTVMLEPFADAVRRDLVVLRALLEQVSTEVHPPVPEVEVPLDPRLQDLAETIGEAARAAGVRARMTSLAELAASSTAGPVYLPPGTDVDLQDLLSERIVFSGRGRGDVEAEGSGVLAARAGRDPSRLARLAALEVLAVIRGLPEAPPPSGGGGDRPVIRLPVADRLGLEIPWGLRLSAELLGPDPERGEPLTPSEARREAVEANLDLRARDLLTAAGEQDVQQALAALRPRLAVRFEGTVVDEDTALASFGARPERQVTAIGEASWILFSEDARAAVDGARRFQAVRELELRELELDIGLEAASGLLAVARARAFEAAERANLESTLADLDAARFRRAVGAAGRADVARLEARAARDRQALVTAHGDRRALEVRLNRLLDRPLDQALRPSVDGIEEDSLGPLPDEDRVVRPASLAALRTRLVDQAREQAPEIAAAKEVVLARERELLAAGRAFYLPTVSAFGSLQAILEEAGEGTEPPTLPGGLGGFPERPDTAWSLGVGVELPLYAGGARSARRTRAELDLEASRRVLEAAEQRVEERVRLALIRLETSYASAVQARLAAEAAASAFDVVRDAYARGAESLTTLLDAQSELLSARRAQAAAAAAALTRRFELQRSVGAFPEADETSLWAARPPRPSRSPHPSHLPKLTQSPAGGAP